MQFSMKTKQKRGEQFVVGFTFPTSYALLIISVYAKSLNNFFVKF